MSQPLDEGRPRSRPPADDGVPSLLALPWDRPPAQHRSPRPRVAAFAVPAGLAKGVADLGRAGGAEADTAWLALWGLFLGRLAGQSELSVGCRARTAWGAATVVPLRLGDNPAIRALVAATGARLRAVALWPPPPFPVMFAHDLAIPLSEPAKAAPADLALTLLPDRDGALVARLDHAQDLFGAATVRRWWGHFLTLVAAAVAGPDTPVLDLPLLSPAQIARQVRIWSGATVPAPPPAELLPRRLLAACRTWPDRTAVVDASGETTYAGLEAWSRALAVALRGLGVGGGDRVGVCLPRGRAWIAALWAVWRAGAAFVSLDPTSPPKRLAGLAGQAAPGVLIDSAALADRVGPGPWRRLTVAGAPLGRPERDDSPADRDCRPGDEACVVFTSGSSGAPKGIRIPHAALAFHAAHAARRFAIAPGEAVLQFAPPGFDVAMEEIWPTLIRGGRLVVCPATARESLEVFTDLCREQDVAVANLPGRFFEAWTAHLTSNRLAVPAGLRLLVTGSEAVGARALADWQRLPGGDRDFLCGYGPTETTVTATFYDPARDGPPDPSGPLPLGRPLPGTWAYVLDARGHAMPPGCVGELHLGGPNLGLGYLEEPRSGNGRFRDDPFRPGQRLYRPGDRARLSPRSAHGPAVLLFAGRADLQIKRRGYRVEPQEIEAVLGSLPGVARSAVVPLEDGRLAALVEAAPGRELVPDVLAAALAEALPGHMRPDLIRPVDRLPQLPNGKPDRLTAATLAALAGDRRRS